eukprot:1488790-Amphidinium_carterae.1
MKAATSMLLVLIGAYLTAKRPSIESFEPAFADWFAKDYYPKVNATSTEPFQRQKPAHAVPATVCSTPSTQHTCMRVSWLLSSPAANALPGGVASLH